MIWKVYKNQKESKEVLDIIEECHNLPDINKHDVRAYQQIVFSFLHHLKALSTYQRY